MASYSLKPANQEKHLEVLIERGSNPQSYSIRFDGHSFDVVYESEGPSRGWLREGGRVLPFFVSRKEKSLQVWVDGAVHSFEIVERTAQRTAGSTSAAQRDDLPAPMPGTILRINVKPGDRFEAHAPLVVMESMKMEMTLSAPHAGRIKEIKCKQGQLVEMGAVLATFVDEPDAAAS